jgi:hypothetical protein
MKRRSFLRVIGAAASAMVLPLPLLGGSTPTVAVVAAPAVVANPHDYLVPEFWARESLKILEQNMAVSELVHRDFGDNPKKALDKVITDRKLNWR